MSELNKTTIQRFKALAGLKRELKTTKLLKEHDPFELPAEPVEEPAEPVEEPAEPVEEPAEPVEEPAEPIEIPETPPGITMEETDPLKVMAENQEKIVDKIADVMLKYLLDK